MRATPESTGRAQTVVRLAIVCGATAVMVLLLRWVVTDALEPEEQRARLDRMCLIEAMLAVRDAMQGVDVPAAMPPSCQAILAGVPTTAPTTSTTL